MIRIFNQRVAMPKLSLRQSVQSALYVHECWDDAVRQMLEHGRAHGPISNLSSQEHARIAQWLNPAPGQEYDAHHSRVVTRHRAFRECVARITDYVVRGDISQAEQLLNTDFSVHSKAVMSALRQWEQDLDAAVVEAVDSPTARESVRGDGQSSDNCIAIAS